MSNKVDSKSSDTEKLIFQLIKVDPNNVDLLHMEKGLKSSKKFAYTKRKIKGICASLSHDSDDYDPAKTIASIDSFMEAEDNMGRILYSEVSSYVFSLSEKDRATFSTNIEKLLLTVLEETKDSEDIPTSGDATGADKDSTSAKKINDRKKFVIKLYDHFQLVLYQIENTDNQYAKSIEKTRQELQTEVKGMEKEYIAILGIFASVVLAFVGGMTFSTSVLENIASASIYRIIILSLIIGFVFINMIWLLIDFIRAVNGNEIKRQYIIGVIDGGIAAAIILTCVACHFGWLDHESVAPHFGQETQITEETTVEQTAPTTSQSMEPESGTDDTSTMENEGTVIDAVNNEQAKSDSSISGPGEKQFRGCECFSVITGWEHTYAMDNQILNGNTTQDSYQECYVAFLDILGFKDLINTQAFEKILDIFKAASGDGAISENEFKVAFHRATDDEDDENAQYNSSLDAVNIYAMSDSIVVSIPCSAPYSLEALVDVCLFLQVRLYDLDTPVLLRGAVAKGMYYCNKSVAFGKGMVNAYLYQENYSVYPRIILSKNLVDELKFDGYKGEKVVQDQRDSYWYIDCLTDYLGSNETDETCQKFRRMIDGYINGYYDAKIRDKYFWLDREYNRIVLGRHSSEGSFFY